YSLFSLLRARRLPPPHSSPTRRSSDLANQHAQAMQSMAAYAATNPLVAPAVWLEIAERELNARRPREAADTAARALDLANGRPLDRKSTRLNSSHVAISYAVFCLKKKK